MINKHPTSNIKSTGPVEQEVKNMYFGISSFYSGGVTALSQCNSHDHHVINCIGLCWTAQDHGTVCILKIPVKFGKLPVDQIWYGHVGAFGSTCSQLFIYIWYLMCSWIHALTKLRTFVSHLLGEKNFEVRTFLCGFCSSWTMGLCTNDHMTNQNTDLCKHFNNTRWESFPNLYTIYRYICLHPLKHNPIHQSTV